MAIFRRSGETRAADEAARIEAEMIRMQVKTVVDQLRKTLDELDAMFREDDGEQRTA
jgi:hypothetical protein